MSAQPIEQSAPEPLTVIFDQTSNFAAVPNLLGYHPGQTALRGWLTMRLAPLAVKKRLKPGWNVKIWGRDGALCDRNGRTLLTFDIVKGHRL